MIFQQCQAWCWQHLCRTPYGSFVLFLLVLPLLSRSESVWTQTSRRVIWSRLGVCTSSLKWNAFQSKNKHFPIKIPSRHYRLLYLDPAHPVVESKSCCCKSNPSLPLKLHCCSGSLQTTGPRSPIHNHPILNNVAQEENPAIANRMFQFYLLY